jgi:hypothetical protein
MKLTKASLLSVAAAACMLFAPMNAQAYAGKENISLKTNVKDEKEKEEVLLDEANEQILDKDIDSYSFTISGTTAEQDAKIVIEKDITISNSDFSFEKADDNDGTTGFLLAGNVTFENCTFTAKEYDGILFELADDATVTFDTCKFDIEKNEDSIIQAGEQSEIDLISTDLEVANSKAENALLNFVAKEETEDEAGNEEEEVLEEELEADNEEEIATQTADIDEDEELIPSALKLQDSTIGVDKADGAVLSNEQSKPVEVKLDNAGLFVSKAKAGFENITLTGNDSSIDVRNCKEAAFILQEESSLNETTVLLENNGSKDIEFDDDATLTIDEATKGKVSVGSVSDDSALTINYKEETETTPSEDETETDDANTQEPETQEPTETAPATIEVVVRYELLNGKTIADSTKETIATPQDAAGYITGYVHDLSKGINGYNYVDYTYEISDTQIVITLRYEEKEAYSVAVNYYLENETTPIHFANVITGLKEGESYDASRFNAIEIEGYTYVSTTGNVTGTVSGADHVINITCYYKKNATTSSTTTTNSTPAKGEVVNTSTQTNSTMYLIIGLAAIVVVVILLVVLLRKKKDDK